MPPVLPESVTEHLANLGDRSARQALYQALPDLAFSAAWYVFEQLADGRDPDWYQLDTIGWRGQAVPVLAVGRSTRGCAPSWWRRGSPG